jgi:hypothetical protein
MANFTEYCRREISSTIRQVMDEQLIRYVFGKTLRGINRLKHAATSARCDVM